MALCVRCIACPLLILCLAGTCVRHGTAGGWTTFVKQESKAVARHFCCVAMCNLHTGSSYCVPARMQDAVRCAMESARSGLNPVRLWCACGLQWA